MGTVSPTRTSRPGMGGTTILGPAADADDKKPIETAKAAGNVRMVEVIAR
jgi:hypothetical protein